MMVPMTRPGPDAAPLIIGATLIAGGLLLHAWKPAALSLPDRPDAAGPASRARRLRDGIMRLLPGNVTQSLGRSLVVAGAGIVLLRLLDLAVEDGEELF